jgi:hypothetical protein
MRAKSNLVGNGVFAIPSRAVILFHGKLKILGEKSRIRLLGVKGFDAAHRLGLVVPLSKIAETRGMA